MFGVSSVLIFAVVWLNLYVNINAHYDHMRHVPQYEGSPEAMGQDNVYSDLKYADSPGALAENWPWSNEFENTAFGKSQDKSNELYNGDAKSIEEPPTLIGDSGSSTSAERLPIPMALEGNGKNSPAKKNLYMSRCSFKICNMGRKRNARYIRLYDIMQNLRKTRSLHARPAM